MLSLACECPLSELRLKPAYTGTQQSLVELHFPHLPMNFSSYAVESLNYVLHFAHILLLTAYTYTYWL